MGARPVSPVGSDGRRRRSAAHAVSQRVRMDRAVRARAVDPLHAGALRRRLVDGWAVVAGRRRSRGLPVVLRAQTGGGDPQCAAAGRHRLHPAQPLGGADPPGLERPLHLAAVRLRGAGRVLRRGARRAEAARTDRVTADPRHEPDLHRLPRLLHRHQAGQPGRRAGDPGGREVRGVRRADDRGRLPGCRAGQGVDAAVLRRPPRRHHRIRGRPGVPGPADRLARRLAAGP
ncbi:hypothetical protein C1Y40_03341 [Mycobacterium talmoniae]|uniref:Uncharacterized protein n=1 Tax=Mycobacterium talmoniae TaxID=1858794 RepID=A0A2S8BIH6_9MYCO|nr:hypothetical protein C1Y40_03341 [Mycobacterium talmoniae]